MAGKDFKFSSNMNKTIMKNSSQFKKDMKSNTPEVESEATKAKKASAKIISNAEQDNMSKRYAMLVIGGICIVAGIILCIIHAV